MFKKLEWERIVYVYVTCMVYHFRNLIHESQSLETVNMQDYFAWYELYITIKAIYDMTKSRWDTI